jgi:hypothetical protein
MFENLSLVIPLNRQIPKSIRFLACPFSSFLPGQRPCKIILLSVCLHIRVDVIADLC